MLSEELRQLIEDKLKFMRFELYDIKYVHAGKHSVLRIFIDKPGGVNIDGTPIGVLTERDDGLGYCVRNTEAAARADGEASGLPMWPDEVPEKVR